MRNYDSLAAKGSQLRKIGYGLVAMLLFALVPSLSSAQGGLDCGTAQVVAPGAHTYSAISGTGAALNCFASGAAGARWYSFTPASDGSLDINSCGSIDTRLSVYSGTCGTLTCVASSDDNNIIACQTGSFGSTIQGEALTGGVTYYFEWDDRWSASASAWEFSFTPSGGGGGQTCATAEVVTPGAYTYPALAGGGASNICFTGATNSHWYEYTPAGDGTIEVYNCGSLDARLSIYSGACGSLTCVASDDDGGIVAACQTGGFTSYLAAVPVTGGITYYIEWDDRWSSASSPWEFNFTPAPTFVGGADCATADVVTPGNYTYDPISGTGASNVCFGSGATGARWYTYTPGGPGTINVYSCDDGTFSVDTRLSVYSGTCGSLVCEAQSDDDVAFPCQTGGLESSVVGLPVVGGTTYYIEWDDRWGTNAAPWTLEFTADIPGNDCVYSNSPALGIVDNTTVTDNIVVAAGAEQITDMNVYMDITHTWLSDMTITLASPNGTIVTLFDSGCGSVDNMDVEWDDEAVDGHGTNCPPLGVFEVPFSALSAYDGEGITGTWTLSITDGASGDTGTLNSWCLIPTTIVPACLAPTLTFNQSNTDCVAGTFDWSLDIAADGDAPDYDVYVNGPPGPDCGVSQAPNAGFPEDPTCEAAVCALDAFCCSNSWDGICAGIASDPVDVGTACDDCLGGVPGTSTFIGTFTGGTTGIALGTFNFGSGATVLVEHNTDPVCHQTEPVMNTEVCGCTDPTAVNPTPGATVDDGSCVYPPANDDCVNAQSLSTPEMPSTANALGNLQGAASASGAPSCDPGADPMLDVFYEFTVTNENHFMVNVNSLGNFIPYLELLDGCGGTVVDSQCLPAGPFCDNAQGSPGFPSDPTCETAVCGGDSFCCSTSWDGICATSAETTFSTECAGCLSPDPNIINLFVQNLAPGTYTLRVGTPGTSPILTSAPFLINVQAFPTAQVQDNPGSSLYACNQTGFQLEDFVGATPQTSPGVLDYDWLAAEVGGGAQSVYVRGAPNYVARIDWLGMEYGKTYNVFVRILYNHPDLGPTWGVYQGDYQNPNLPGASPCTISTSSNVSPTELRPNYTPTNAQGNNYALCDFAVAYNVQGSENFRWRFDGNGIPGDAEDIIYTRGTGNPSVRLSWVNNLTPGLTYNVAVEVQVAGQWSGYSTVLPLTLALTPNDVEIRPSFCGGTYASNGYILSESVCDADLYQFRFTPSGGGTPSFRNSGNYVCFMSAANPALTPGDYDVQVKVTQNGVPGDWGPVCTITIAGPQGQVNDMPAVRDIEATGSAMLFPNPNAGQEVRVNLDGLSDGNHQVMIQIYDVYGKLISNDGFGHEGNSLSRLVRFDGDMATGMYMVQITVDGERFATERLIVK